MAESAPDPGPDETGATGEPGWGRVVLDAAGIVAALFLAVILVDVLTDGRLISRRLRPRDDDDRTAD